MKDEGGFRPPTPDPRPLTPNSQRIIVDICHPAQVHLFRPVLEVWRESGVQFQVVARDKDITLDLLAIYDIPYKVLARSGLRTWGQLRELLQREIAMFRLARQFRPAVITGTSPNAVRVARLLRAKSIILCEDDASYIPRLRRLAYPLASAIVTPDSLAYEKHGAAHLTYPSYQKLFYLHPNRFTPQRAVIEQSGFDSRRRYAIIRLSSLTAHHDSRARGLSEDLIRRVLELVGDRVRVFITSEKPLSPEFEPLRLPIPPQHIHHALAFAEFFLGDSQSMTMESALLGTPAFKINTFAGIISVIRELEAYGLAYGYRPGQEESLIRQLARVLEMDNPKDEFQKRRERMLSEKIDPLPWFLAVIRMLLQGASAAEVKEWSTAALQSGEFHSPRTERSTITRTTECLRLRDASATSRPGRTARLAGD